MSLEGHLQQRGCAVSGVGVCESCPQEGWNMQPKIFQHTHTQTQLFFCCVFSDILSNPSQGELMRIKKSAVSGATRLREHFLHTFT